ncbi:MAG: phosphoenolpyruvate--protein phosphotransferase [Pseudomonadales bacterium]|nr:phosphoenolpyruvate--protein phosphotransferase [Pseudomonadales bacterium]NRA14860.1 phosphoenolpyruvate--protein phosphotransferase [Oceanospirillaceae bacterium]
MLKLLRKIVTEVRAESDLEAVLKLIVCRIQEGMNTQVCSIYLKDTTNQRLILRATEGLHQKSIGSSLSQHEGVVGLVANRAEPVNTDDIEQHPSYCFVPGTGEERYHSFLGVPIIYQRKVLGVLVIQQFDGRRYKEAEESFLVTVSAQLAGIIIQAEASAAVTVTKLHKKYQVDRCFIGVSGSPGIAIGKMVVVSESAELDSVAERQIEDTDTEVRSFESALEHVRSDIRSASARLAQKLGEQEQALFDVYLRMLEDNSLAGEIVKRITQGNWAQWALSSVVLEHCRQFDMMDDPYLKERASDIRDLGKRILAYLQEQKGPQSIDLAEGSVLVAEELSPAMLGEIHTDNLLGLISVKGSGNSHAAILARSMGIPTVMGAVDLPYKKLSGRTVVLDGHSGRLYLNPSQELLQIYQAQLEQEQQQEAELDVLKMLPAETQDGVTMPLWVNTGLIADVQRALDKGAEGIGLYRTEIPFMIRNVFPSEHEQTQIYTKQLEAFAPRPVTMRTLDIGGDKSLNYFPIEEENPFLGWRGVRVTLDHPEIFLVQIRAMLRANDSYGNLRIMLPMVTSINEVTESIALIDQAVRELCEEGLKVERPPVGVMIEVPAALYLTRVFARHVDFISVGSNDLTQYLLAVDRNNPRVASLYSSYHPAVLQALKYIVKEAQKEQVDVSICGEMAADPAGALLLMAMGYNYLSMNANNIPRIKSVIRNCNFSEARVMLKKVLRLSDIEEIKTEMQSSLSDMGLGSLLKESTFK